MQSSRSGTNRANTRLFSHYLLSTPRTRRRRFLGFEQLEQRVVLSTYWVSNSGNDSHAGSQASPWLTLQHAVNSVSPGDTININAGTYAGFNVSSAHIGTSSNWITIQGAPGTTRDQVIIATKGPNSTHQLGIQFGDTAFVPYYWTVSGLSVIPADSTQFANEGIYITGSNVTINNCVVNGNGYTMGCCYTDGRQLLDSQRM